MLVEIDIVCSQAIDLYSLLKYSKNAMNTRILSQFWFWSSNFVAWYWRHFDCFDVLRWFAWWFRELQIDVVLRCAYFAFLVFVDWIIISVDTCCCCKVSVSFLAIDIFFSVASTKSFENFFRIQYWRQKIQIEQQNVWQNIFCWNHDR